MENKVLTITNVTSLVEAKSNYQNSLPLFTVNWSYTGQPDVKYKLYRFIGEFPNNFNIDPVVNTENYVFISDIDSDQTSYVDDFDDLNLHGYTYTNNIWIDSNGNNIIDQILSVKRKLFYKLIAINRSTVQFNSLPFIYIGHDDGTLVCISPITQVKFNNLYLEGDKVWEVNIGGVIKNIAVDANLHDRRGLVWVAATSGSNGIVKCLDIKTGGTNFSKTYNFTYPVYSIRVDPDTGNAYVGGKKNKITICYLSTGLTQDIGSTSLSVGNYGNYGLSLRKNNNTKELYTIWDKHYITVWNVSTPGASTIISADNYGGYLSTQYSPYGICNGPNSQIYVNARLKTTVNWTETVNTQETVCADYSKTSCSEPSNVCWKKNKRDCVWDPGCGADCWYWSYKPWVTIGSNYTSDYSTTFFSDYGYIYKITDALGNQNFTNCAMPGHNSYPCVGNGHDTPDPNTRSGTYDGLHSDIPTLSLTGGTFNLWQADSVEDVVHKIDSGLGSSITNFSVTNPSETIVDSENNIWGISKDSLHKKYYQLQSNTDFPSGGLCTWPVYNSNKWNYGSYLNDEYIEYVATRNATDTIYAQITSSSTNEAIKRQLAREWVALSGLNIQGLRVYPNYSGSAVSFVRYNASESYHPNSDASGLSYIFSDEQYSSIPAIGYPTDTTPSFTLVFNPQQTTPLLNDSDFWINQKVSNVNNVSGYDDLTVQMTVSSLLSSTSFEIYGYDFGYGDKTKDLGCSGDYPNCGNNPSSSLSYLNGRLQSNYTTYKYHDPSVSGKPGSRRSGYPGESTGTFTPRVSTYVTPSVYSFSGVVTNQDEDVVITTGSVTVFERWPTARFYIKPCHLNELREHWFNTTEWAKPDSTNTSDSNGLPITNENRVVSGYAPLSAQIVDISIARTWPICAWYIDFGSNETPYSSLYHIITDYSYATTYPLQNEDRSNNSIFYSTSTAVVTTYDANYHIRDSASVSHNSFASHVYFYPGTYYMTLYVQASNTGTESAIISSGITDQNVISGFTKYATRQINVLENCPWANFITTSAITVPYTYVDDNTGMYTPICAAYVSHSLISGYAPNLTITWRDSSVARSFPICAYEWDFGDYFDEVHNLSSIYVGTLNTGYPTWYTDKTNHYVTHTYSIPGLYDVSLDLEVSGRDTRACEVCTKHLHVYVEEIPSQPNFVVSQNVSSGYTTSVSGTTPITLYFNPSTTQLGSFQICKIDWDFDDGSDILTITRKPSTESFIGPIAYPSVPEDPRNVIVEHLFDRKLQETNSIYHVSMSAYACNSNNVQIATLNVGPIALRSMDNDFHLINNRMFNKNNDTLLVFENNNGIVNYVLSAVNNV